MFVQGVHCFFKPRSGYKGSCGIDAAETIEYSSAFLIAGENFGYHFICAGVIVCGTVRTHEGNNRTGVNSYLSYFLIVCGNHDLIKSAAV